MIRLGYACINTQLPSAGRTCRLKNASEENILSLSRRNLSALKQILLWNRDKGIGLFRISSETIPFGSHPVNRLPWRRLLKTESSELGRLIAKYKMRVSMHPGQYTVLNSIRETVVAASIAELEYHARLMDAFSLDAAHKIILHLGGTYGDKKNGMKRFVRNFEKLSLSVQKRLVIENDEKNYTVADTLTVARELQVPMILDVFHHRCNPSLQKLGLLRILESIASTWQPQDGPQKIHYSDQKKGGPVGSHSENINVTGFKRFYRRIQHLPLDIMLEVKNKEQSVLALYRRIPSLQIKF
ncbi:MAG: UV DNA damage repair endonuclease UvsE [Desulfobacterales bacterium]|nr:UV DNA damage repair endonuclease UvsE [Desulfobacterales bacterium]